jgi:streptogramin lyase/DNA-binding CsgD family transcriptional regulator
LDLFNRETQQFTSFFTSFHKDYGSEVLTIRTIAEDRYGKLWLGTFGLGLIYFDPNDCSYKMFRSNEKVESSIGSDFIWTLFYDSSDILWIGTAGGGLYKYDENRHKFPVYRVMNDEKSPVSAIFEDSKKNFWLGSRKGCLVQMNRKLHSYKKILEGKLFTDITAITEDRNENIWIGTGDDGLVQYNLRNNAFHLFKQFNAAMGTGFVITALFCDKKGNLWIAAYDKGLFMIDSHQLQASAFGNYNFIQYQNKPNDFSSLSSNIIWAINEDEAGNIWLATDKFMDKFNAQTGKFDHIGGYSYSCIYKDKPGILWVGTYGKGIAKLNLKDYKLEYFNSSRGLGHDIVNSITGDANGNLWIGTAKGISKFNTLNGSIQNYDKSDGLQGNLFLHNSCCSLDNGELAFGGTSGFNIFKPEEIKNTANDNTVIISDIKLFNKSLTLDSAKYLEAIGKCAIAEASELNLNFGDKVVTLEFAALNFSTPEKQKFLCKLEGFDKDWVIRDAQNRMATYTNLDDGHYVFKVKTLNPDGTINRKETQLQIYIHPPYYKSWWFRILAVLLTIGIVFYFIRKRIRYINGKYQKIQLKNEQELIRLKNEKLDSELSHKNSELNSRTLSLIHKNEKILEIKNQLMNTLPLANGQVLNGLQSLLRTIDKEMEDDSHWDQFEYHFNQTHDDFLKRFKEAYPVLTHNDLKLSAYMRMNLQNHQIAALMNISIRSVETNRYRIRRKIALDKPKSLAEYILRF